MYIGGSGLNGMRRGPGTQAGPAREGTSNSRAVGEPRTGEAERQNLLVHDLGQVIQPL